MLLNIFRFNENMALLRKYVLWVTLSIAFKYDKLLLSYEFHIQTHTLNFDLTLFYFEARSISSVSSKYENFYPLT